VIDPVGTPTDGYVRAFTLGRVIDGDTIVVDEIDLGYHVAVMGVEFRLLRVNCPEMHKPTRAAGEQAREFTVQWFADHEGRAPFYAQTVKTDSFGRYLAEVTCAGDNLSDDLLASGNAVPYM
jgi:endonuclease YncB( thermonuclease family)